MEEDTFCYQRSLRAGRRNQTYRGVGDSLAYAGMAFGVLLIIVFALEIIGTALELRKGRKVGVWRYAVAAKGTGKTRGKGRSGNAVDPAGSGGFWAVDAGGGGGGAGDGGGGGDGEGGGGGGDGGGGC